MISNAHVFVFSNIQLFFVLVTISAIFYIVFNFVFNSGKSVGQAEEMEKELKQYKDIFTEIKQSNNQLRQIASLSNSIISGAGLNLGAATTTQESSSGSNKGRIGFHIKDKHES